MSKDKLRELLSQLWLQDISADEAFDELEDLIDRIHRLEEAGDRAIENSYYPDRVKVWHKAKEDKP